MSSVVESASREDLLAVIGLLQRQVAAAEAQTAELAAANERLTARVAELERRLGRNSGNSSMPPSSDTFGGPRKKPQVKSGRKRGGQPGAGGNGLSMVACPDVTEDHVPAACTGCGSSLGESDSIGYERRQVRDIPLTMVKVTERRAHRCRCACGTVTTSPMPEEIAGSPSSYGTNLRALAVYLLVFQHVPVERTAILIRDVTGAEDVHRLLGGPPSRGGRPGRGLAEPDPGPAGAGARAARETGPPPASGPRSAGCTWPAPTSSPCSTSPRAPGQASQGGVLPHYRGVLVHDSLSLYAGYTHCAHQLCGARLIRELTAGRRGLPRREMAPADPLGTGGPEPRGPTRALRRDRRDGPRGPAAAPASVPPRHRHRPVPPSTRRGTEQITPPATCWNTCGTGPMPCSGSPTIPGTRPSPTTAASRTLSPGQDPTENLRLPPVRRRCHGMARRALLPRLRQHGIAPSKPSTALSPAPSGCPITQTT